MSENMEAASMSLQEMLGNLNEVSRKVRNGEGTLGRLVSDEQLYRDLQSTLASVNSLLEDIKRDPTRYFKLSIF
jgi:phospholipid/cholesterol/gamma-HCH transport system substrate-binding protein